MQIPLSTSAGFAATTDSSGNPAGNVVNAGNNIPIGVAKSIASLDGGEYVAHPVTEGKTYQIDSESMDVYVATASSPNIYGSTFASGEAVRNTSVTNLDNAAFQWGSSDLSFEAWTTIDNITTGSDAFFVIGDGATAEVRLYLMEDDATGNIEAGCFAEDTGGLTEFDTGNIASGISNESGRIYHIVLTLERTVEATLYIDGVPVATVLDAAFTAGDGGGSINFAASGQIGIMAAINGSAQAEGTVYSFKAYESLLTPSQIAELNKYGPGFFPTTVYPAITVDFAQDTGNWVAPDEPEVFTYDGTTRTALVALDTNVGTYDASDSLAVITGNDVARVGINSRIRANYPTLVTIPTGASYLLLYSLPAAGGDVEIFG